MQGEIMGKNIIRWALLLGVIFGACGVQAQEDSIRLPKDTILLQGKANFFPSMKSAFSEDKSFYFPMAEPTRPLPKFTLPKREPDLRLPYQENPSPMFKGDFSTGGPMVRWRTGMLNAKGSQITMPGLGRLNEAAFGFRQGASHSRGGKFPEFELVLAGFEPELPVQVIAARIAGYGFFQAVEIEAEKLLAFRQGFALHFQNLPFARKRAHGERFLGTCLFRVGGF